MTKIFIFGLYVRKWCWCFFYSLFFCILFSLFLSIAIISLLLAWHMQLENKKQLKSWINNPCFICYCLYICMIIYNLCPLILQYIMACHLKGFVLNFEHWKWLWSKLIYILAINSGWLLSKGMHFFFVIGTRERIGSFFLYFDPFALYVKLVLYDCRTFMICAWLSFDWLK